MKEYFSDEQRNDPELCAAVLAKLVKHREDLNKVISLMTEAYLILSQSDDLERTGYNSRNSNALGHLRSDTDKLKWYVKYILTDLEEHTANGTSAYVENKAAFLTSGRAEKLKEEYREGKI